jgi:hypothetical protein
MMKRLPIIVVLTASALMAACSIVPKSMGGSAAYFEAETQISAQPIAKTTRNPDVPADRVVIQDEKGSALVQKVAFRPGVSSASVEHLAKGLGCSGRAGAALVTDKGPVEVYRLQCDNGTSFLARCELRQCRPMH